MKKIKIKTIIETSYSNDSHWIIYEFKNDEGNVLTGYDLIYGTSFNKEILETYYNSIESLNSYSTKKIKIDNINPYLSKLIRECSQSENEMLFVEYEEIEELAKNQNVEIKELLLNTQRDVVNLGIDEYIRFEEDEALISVYGGVITKFLF